MYAYWVVELLIFSEIYPPMTMISYICWLHIPFLHFLKITTENKRKKNYSQVQASVMLPVVEWQKFEKPG